MQMRYERKAGFPRKEAAISTLQFEAAWILEQLFEREEIEMQVKSKQAMFAVLGFKDV